MTTHLFEHLCKLGMLSVFLYVGMSIAPVWMQVGFLFVSIYVIPWERKRVRP